MNQLQRAREIVATYRTHGWQLRRALLRPETLQLLSQDSAPTTESSLLAPKDFENVLPIEAAIDALWFSRPSHAGREAWELRLVGDTPYALFEVFEADEAEEDREDVRREMEARVRDYTGQT